MPTPYVPTDLVDTVELPVWEEELESSFEEEERLYETAYHIEIGGIFNTPADGGATADAPVPFYYDLYIGYDPAFTYVGGNDGMVTLPTLRYSGHLSPRAIAQVFTGEGVLEHYREHAVAASV